MVWALKQIIDLSEVMMAVEPAPHDMPCTTARDRLLAAENLPAIPVLDAAQKPIGVLNRYRFLYAAAVHENPEAVPVSALMNETPTVLERRQDVSDLFASAFKAESGNLADNAIVVEDGVYVGVISSGALLRFITMQMQSIASDAQSARREAEAATQSKSRFLANMTHELRTPLNGVLGFGQLLQNEAHGPIGAPEYKLYVKDIVDSGAHLLDIINDILDLAKLEAGHIDLDERFVDLRDIVGGSLRMVATLAGHKKIELKSSILGPKWTMRLDERRIRQSLVNLLSNAIKFSPMESTVNVDIGYDDDWVWIEVRDNGCGIAEEDLRLLFKPFQQANNTALSGESGTGLGLTITRALMQAHQGEVGIESTVGFGTSTRLKLPTSRALAEEFTWSPNDTIELLDPSDAESDIAEEQERAAS